MGYKNRLLLLTEATPEWTKTHLIEIVGPEYEVPIYQLNVPEIVTLYMTHKDGWDAATYNDHLTTGYITTLFVHSQYIALLVQMRDTEIDFSLEGDQEASNKTLAALYQKACMSSVDPMECLQFELDRIATSGYVDSQVQYIQSALDNGWLMPPLMEIIESYFDTLEENDIKTKSERYLLEENPQEAIRDCWIFIGSDAQDFLEGPDDADDLTSLEPAELISRLAMLPIDVSLDATTLASRIAIRKDIKAALRTRGFKQSWTYDIA